MYTFGSVDMLQRSVFIAYNVLIITIVILKDFLFNGINKKNLEFIFFAAECMHERTIPKSVEDHGKSTKTGFEMRLFLLFHE